MGATLIIMNFGNVLSNRLANAFGGTKKNQILSGGGNDQQTQKKRINKQIVKFLEETVLENDINTDGNIICNQLRM